VELVISQPVPSNKKERRRAARTEICWEVWPAQKTMKMLQVMGTGSLSTGRDCWAASAQWLISELLIMVMTEQQ
jgi:hypothetical protein